MIKIIHEKEVTETYNLTNVFTYWRDVYNRSIKNYYVIFCEGDLHIKQHLILDEGDGWSTESQQWLQTIFGLAPLGGKKNCGIAGLIVMGNLTVDGSIINANSGYGNGLYVHGNLKAHNLIAGGSSIFVTGSANIEQCTYGHYNDGLLVINGALNCPIQISVDHSFDVRPESFEFSYDSNEEDFDSESEFGAEDLYPGDGNELIPNSLRPLLNDKISNWSDILETLTNGAYISISNQHQLETHPIAYYQNLIDGVISKGGDSKPNHELLKRVPEQMRTLALCQQVIQFEPTNLKYVPNSLIDAQLCHLAISQNGNKNSLHGGYSATLSYVPEEFITDELCRLHIQNCAGEPVCAYVPDTLKNKDFCLYAIKHRCFTLDDLPENLENDEDLILEIVKNSIDAFSQLPRKLTKQAKFQLAGIIGGCFDDVNEALIQYKKQNTLPQLLHDAIAERMEVAENIPGYAFTSQLLEQARTLYSSVKEWRTIENKHSEEFWRYTNSPDYIAEIAQDIKSEERYVDAFEIIWKCFWTEEFLIKCIAYSDPYAAIDLLPKDVFTNAVVRACRKHDRYGYYETYLHEFGF